MPFVDDSLGRLITKEQLNNIFKRASSGFLEQIANELNADLKKYGLDTVLRRAHFFSQVRQESNLSLEPEGLQYRPEVLLDKFKYYQRHPAEAQTDGYQKDPITAKITRNANQQAIANKAYATLSKNHDEGDGWRYRGRGFIQLTGRGNYIEITQVYKEIYSGATMDFEKNPDALATFPYAARSAVCFWIQHKLHKLADIGSAPSDVNRITKIINSGMDGEANRRKYFIETLNAFK